MEFVSVQSYLSTIIIDDSLATGSSASVAPMLKSELRYAFLKSAMSFRLCTRRSLPVVVEVELLSTYLSPFLVERARISRLGLRFAIAEVIALVCNFSKPHNSSVVSLNHSDVDTLFHEFGHALHSLLSRTDYQHFSGTRVAFDMAETPSNLFEYYAWDYRVLKNFARHYSTGDSIPEKLVELMVGARKMFSGMELQQQG